MISLILLFSLLFSAAIVQYFLPKIMLLSLKNRILDKIDSRKVHSTAASRLGGASFLPAIIVSSIISVAIFDFFDVRDVDSSISINSLMLICSAMILYFVGLYDDIVGMRYKEKFFFQFITAAMIIYTGDYISNFNGLFGIWNISPFVGVPLTLILIVFITNAINLIDGIDGLASMLSMMAFAVYATMTYINGNYTSCIFSLTALGALAPFWLHNVFGLRRGIKSKIFMGDGGALVIGFILSAMAIKLWNTAPDCEFSYDFTAEFSWIAAYTMLIIPCFDVVRVVVYRGLEHKPLFLPDKSHFHHRLISLGLNPRQSLVALLLLNIVFLSVNALMAYFNWTLTNIAIVDVCIWLIVHRTLSYKIHNHNKKE